MHVLNFCTTLHSNDGMLLSATLVNATTLPSSLPFSELDSSSSSPRFDINSPSLQSPLTSLLNQHQTLQPSNISNLPLLVHITPPLTFRFLDSSDSERNKLIRTNRHGSSIDPDHDYGSKIIKLFYYYLQL